MSEQLELVSRGSRASLFTVHDARRLLLPSAFCHFRSGLQPQPQRGLEACLHICFAASSKEAHEPMRWLAAGEVQAGR